MGLRICSPAIFEKSRLSFFSHHSCRRELRRFGFVFPGRCEQVVSQLRTTRSLFLSQPSGARVKAEARAIEFRSLCARSAIKSTALLCRIDRDSKCISTPLVYKWTGLCYVWAGLFMKACIARLRWLHR